MSPIPAHAKSLLVVIDLRMTYNRSRTILKDLGQGRHVLDLALARWGSHDTVCIVAGEEPFPVQDDGIRILMDDGEYPASPIQALAWAMARTGRDGQGLLLSPCLGLITSQGLEQFLKGCQRDEDSSLLVSASPLRATHHPAMAVFTPGTVQDGPVHTYTQLGRINQPANLVRKDDAHLFTRPEECGSRFESGLLYPDQAMVLARGREELNTGQEWHRAKPVPVDHPPATPVEHLVSELVRMRVC